MFEAVLEYLEVMEEVDG
jgi:hypothetical protein